MNGQAFRLQLSFYDDLVDFVIIHLFDKLIIDVFILLAVVDIKVLFLFKGDILVHHIDFAVGEKRFIDVVGEIALAQHFVVMVETEAVKILQITLAEAPERMDIVFGIFVKILLACRVHHIVTVRAAVYFRNQVVWRIVLAVGGVEHIHGGVGAEEQNQRHTGDNQKAVARPQLFGRHFAAQSLKVEREQQ